MKDRAERCDLEAGMAKLFASETAQELAVTAVSLHGPAGRRADRAVERHYRDTPLMLIGEGTNEIQRTLIARQLAERYGERLGALTSREGEALERRQMVLAVRQVVDKDVAPVCQELDRAGAYPAELVGALADLGVLGAVIPQDWGGLGLDVRTYAMLVEELARGSAALATVVARHAAVAHALARFGTDEQKHRILAPMASGAPRWTGEPAGPAAAARDGDGWRLEGAAPPTDNATRVAGFLVEARAESGSVTLLVGRDTPGVRLGEPVATLGLRGVDPCAVAFAGARLAARDVLGSPGRGDEPIAAALALARLGAAATAVGVAQAAFEAALRYSQQRTAFGKPIAQHQAIQLKLADMATRITAARLLAEAAAEHGLDADRLRMAKIYASDTAYDVTLEAMRIHGGYGYTAEVPVERYYRDAAHLLVTPAWAWALGGVVVGAAVPSTLLVVMPPARRLLASAPLDDRDAGALLRRWGRLHWIRSGLGAGGLVVLLLAAHLR